MKKNDFFWKEYLDNNCDNYNELFNTNSYYNTFIKYFNIEQIKKELSIDKSIPDIYKSKSCLVTKKILRIPKRINYLINLQTFSCCGVGLEKMPKNINYLKNIACLNMDNDKIKKIPKNYAT